MDKEADLLALGSFLVLSAGLTLFHTFPKDPLDISSVMLTVAGSLLQNTENKNKYCKPNINLANAHVLNGCVILNKMNVLMIGKLNMFWEW